MLTEPLTWHDVGERMPDTDVTVLCRFAEASEPVWPGFWDGEVWREANGTPMTVIRWADMPEGGAA